MDFKTTEAADDLGGLARTITESVCTPEHQRELDGLDERFDRDLWGKLIDADILSAARRSRWAAAVSGCWSRWRCWPRWAASSRRCRTWSRSCSAPARWRSSDPMRCSRSGRYQRSTARRSSTVALDGEMGEGPVQAQPPSGDGYRLTGTRTLVGYGPVADAFLVPAETDSGTKVFLVAAD